MKFRLFLSVIIVAIAVKCYSQNKPAKSYVDMAISGTNLWVLDAEGNVNLFDTSTGTERNKIATDCAITSLTVNHNGQLIVVDDKQQIKLWDAKSLTFQIIGVCAVPVSQVVCNNKNEIFLITQTGLQV
jgi:hypothetical protein